MQSSKSTQPRKGLALASLIIGFISIPTLGLFLVGTITGLVLGIIALRKANNDPAHYGGKGLALGGIITSAASVVTILISAAIALPTLQNQLKGRREEAAVKALRAIHESEQQFQASKNRYGTLKELADAGLLDKSYASGQPINQYIFTDSEVGTYRYCVHADREYNGSGNRDFNITERGIISYIESKTKGTVQRGTGTPLSAP